MKRHRVEKAAPGPATAAGSKLARGARAAAGVLVLAVLLVPPLLLAPTLKEPFRLPKLLASEGLALLSLAVLCLALLDRRLPPLRRLARHPALLAVVPLLLLAGLGLISTEHPEHVREALWSFAVGAAALVGWSLGLEQRLRLLPFAVGPALFLAFVGALQFHGFVPRWFVASGGERLGLTSLAGSVGDFAAFLVLPSLIAQYWLWRSARERERGPSRKARSAEQRWRDLVPLLWAVAAGVCVYALLLTQTLTAILALGLGSVVLWLGLLPRRWGLSVLGASALLLLAGLLLVRPLGERVREKGEQVRQLELNALVSGRLDGWKAGLWMLRERPLAGVGHGAYGAAFGLAKLAMVEEGVAVFSGHRYPIFGNAHNEYIEVAADVGLPGLLALLFGLLILGRRLAKRLAAGAAQPQLRGEAFLALAGTVALAVLAFGYFPFRIAVTAYPALLFLSWMLSDEFLPPPVSEAAT